MKIKDDFRVLTLENESCILNAGTTKCVNLFLFMFKCQYIICISVNILAGNKKKSQITVWPSNAQARRAKTKINADYNELRHKTFQVESMAV